MDMLRALSILDNIEKKVNELSLYVDSLETERDLLKAELERVNIAFELATKALDKQNPEWISVEDRLPEEKQNVLAYDINDVGVIYIAFYFDGLWRQDDIPHVGVDTISHWMPLPEPPKPKEPTFKDVFLKAFPKVQIDERGIPRITCCTVFPYLNDGRNICQRFEYCYECWNQPYFEPEEEGEADA